MRRFLAIALWLALGLAGCRLPEPTIPPEKRLAVPSATPSPGPSPTSVASPSATATASGTPTRTPTPTLLPSATPTLAHPLDVEAMRRRSYLGSELVVERRLEPGNNYARYIVSYQSDGLTQYAYLTVPQGARPESGWPVVLFCHGYIPPDQYRSTERYVAYVDAFARQGYIVLRPDYRGHGDSEGVASGSGTPDYTIDVLNALASIRRHPEADPDRIGMWGHSMGGGITLRAMVVRSDVQAGVIWAGMVASYPHMLGFYLGPPGPAASTPGVPTPRAPRRWALELLEQYGTVEESPAFWAAISPNSYVADLAGPVQIHHGTADETVPLAYSLELEQQIAAVGRPVELWLYEGDDHNISKNWGTAMTRSVAFMDRWVKGIEQAP